MLNWWSCSLCLVSAGCGARTELHGSFATLAMLCPTDASDPRVPVMQVGQPSALDAALFLEGDPNLVRWRVIDQDCDGIATYPSYRIEDPTQMLAQLTPGRPYPYRVRLEAALGSETPSFCEFDIPVESEGLRVEACWTDDQVVDLDLFLHTPRNQNQFLEWGTFENEFGSPSGGVIATVDSCNVLNCTPVLRMDLSRVDFGYADSDIEQCAGPNANRFVQAGTCPNPRMSVDTNSGSDDTTDASGAAERIQIDRPGEGDTFRVMLRNFNNLPTTPFVFIYCNGVRTALAPPDSPPEFTAQTDAWFTAPGVMWRPVDITTHTDQQNELSCDVAQLTHPSNSQQPYVTVDDWSY